MPTKTIATEQDARDFLKADGDSDAAWRAALDRDVAEKRKAEAREKVRGDLKYHPRHERDAALRKVDEEHDRLQRELEELVTTERGILLHDAPDFEATAEAHRELPDVVPAFERRNGGGTSDHTYVSLLLLDTTLGGQVAARLKERELTAVQLEEEYGRLVEGDADEPRANITLRCIEAHRDDLVSVVKAFDPLREVEQETALRRLRGRIASTRQARVPEAITKAIAAIADGKRALDKVRNVRKLQLVSRATLADAKKWRQG